MHVGPTAVAPTFYQSSPNSSPHRNKGFVRAKTLRIIYEPPTGGFTGICLLLGDAGAPNKVNDVDLATYF